MRAKKLIGLMLIVAVLAALAIVKKNEQKAAQQKQLRAQEMVLAPVGALDRDAVKKIIAYKGGEPEQKLTLSLDAKGGWTVENLYNFAGRKDAIDEILKVMGSLKGDVRGNDKKLFGDFQIEDARSLHLLFEDGSKKELGHYVISMEKQGWKSFVRLFNSAQVFIVESDLPALVCASRHAKLDGNCLADLTLYSFEPKEVEKVEISGRVEIKAVRAKEKAQGKPQEKAPAQAQDTWDILIPNSKDKAQYSGLIDRVVGTFSHLRASTLVGKDDTGFGFEKPYLKITMYGAEGKRLLQVVIGESQRGGRAYPLKDVASGFVYQIPDFYIEDFDRLPSASDELRKAPRKKR
jgi:hypothetical protein